jgi:putative multiple sugar transport system ATP-binding protein
MKVLSGVYPHGTYEGRIVYNGQEQKYSGIADSRRAGIAIIHQEPALVPEMSLYENIYFGHELTRGLSINWNETIVQATALLQRLHVTLNPATKVREVGVGTQQLVEIAKALSQQTQLLILDEPTAALSERDSHNLLELLEGLKAQGVTCIMISHKLSEVLSIADTITVLRDGKTIVSLDASDRAIPEHEIIKYMVGRDIEHIYPKRTNRAFGDVNLELRDWNVVDARKGTHLLKDINLHVRQGEIVGIAGLIGAGRTELALSIFGNPQQFVVEGEILVGGHKQALRQPKDAIDAGLAYVSEDRKRNGLILIQDVKTNITFAHLKTVATRGVIDDNEEIQVANQYVKSLGIKASSIRQIVGTLSGGNQQKVSLGKWLFVAPTTLILDEPTRGIDVGAKFEIYSLMNALVEQGMSIIMISSDLLEILGMSDRIYVVAAGRITGEVSADDATQEHLMTLATAS